MPSAPEDAAVTAVVNLHREGYMALRSLRSARAAVQFARENGIAACLSIVIDDGDRLTRSLVERWVADGEACATVGFRNLALAKNHAAANARSAWVAYLDGDDLWDRNWLALAMAAATADSRQVVWHPELSIYFGARRMVVRHVDMDAADFDVFTLACSNLWTALCLARRDFLVAHPYPAIDLGQKIGFEDWSWNREIIRAGAIHKIVPGTAHIIRSRPDSLGVKSAATGARPAPTLLFQEELQKRVARNGAPAGPA